MLYYEKIIMTYKDWYKILFPNIEVHIYKSAVSGHIRAWFYCWQQGPWGEAMGILGHSPSLHPVEGPPCPESWPGQMPPSLV